MQANSHSNHTTNPTNPTNTHKSKTVVYLLIVLIVTIILFYVTKSDDVITFFLILATLMIMTFSVMFCVKCCCRRRLSRGAVLSPHVMVTSQVVANSRAPNRGNGVVVCEPIPHTQHIQHTTPLMSSGLQSTPFTPCIPSAPPIDGYDLNTNQTLPTYEEAIQSKY